MRAYDKITPPREGEPIRVRPDKTLEVPAHPIIPFIRGDGTGVDITPAMQRVVDAAVKKSFGGERQIVWFEIYAGERSLEVYGKDQWLPEDTLRAIEDYVVSIKGPLTTPVGGGIRSLNVTLRQRLDLYACVRPVRWFEGVPAPVKEPQKLDVVIFRENTEDVYAGIEWKAGSAEATKVIGFVNGLLGSGAAQIRAESGIGIKPMSAFGTQRLVRRALKFALERGRKSVTLVHKGNIMKYTEGAFRDWGYELAAKEHAGDVVTETDLGGKLGGKMGAAKVLLNDRIADSMFQQLLLRPDEYSVLATPNLNGDYLSDACAAQVGGLGMAPGGNIGDDAAMFEATHGTAPKYAGQDKVNPGSIILSAVMMLEHMGWNDAADRITKGIEGTIRDKIVTYDLERQMQGAKLVGSSGFADAIIERL